jgi:hypothetical protein
MTRKLPGFLGRVRWTMLLGVVPVLGAMLILDAARAQKQGDKDDHAAWYEARRQDPTIGLKSLKTVRILFIGNSHTYLGDLPHMIKTLLEADGSGIKVETKMHWKPAYCLDQHWDDKVAAKLINDSDWDFVVLQDNINRPFDHPELMTKAIKDFDELIKKRKAITLLFGLWARKDSIEKQPKVNAAYFEAAKKLGAEVAPVGPAWTLGAKEVRTEKFYSDDGSHVGPAGIYTAACVFYATIAGKSPVGLPPKIIAKDKSVQINFPEATARALQEASWSATKDSRSEWMQDSKKDKKDK